MKNKTSVNILVTSLEDLTPQSQLELCQDIQQEEQALDYVVVFIGEPVGMLQYAQEHRLLTIIGLWKDWVLADGYYWALTAVNRLVVATDTTQFVPRATSLNLKYSDTRTSTLTLTFRRRGIYELATEQA